MQNKDKTGPQYSAMRDECILLQQTSLNLHHFFVTLASAWPGGCTAILLSALRGQIICMYISLQTHTHTSAVSETLNKTSANAPQT